MGPQCDPEIDPNELVGGQRDRGEGSGHRGWASPTGLPKQPPFLDRGPWQGLAQEQVRAGTSGSPPGPWASRSRWS